jgi:hypothetical protein
MNRTEQADAIRGKTIRLTWLDGPTKGKVYEHEFHDDGTVEWRDVVDPGTGSAAAGRTTSVQAAERPPYAAIRVADGVYAVSYLALSGFTLTVILNFQDRRMVGFASGAKEWHPLRGTFEVVR